MLLCENLAWIQQFPFSFLTVNKNVKNSGTAFLNKNPFIIIKLSVKLPLNFVQYYPS